MFEALKNKLSGWFGAGKKEEKAKQTGKGKKAKKAKKEKIAKAPKARKIGKAEEGKERSKKLDDSNIKLNEVVSEELIENKKVEEVNDEEVKEGVGVELEVGRGFGEESDKEDSAEEETEDEIKDAVVKEEKSSGGFFSRFFKKVVGSTVTVKREEFDEMFSEIEMSLLENNVALEVVDKIKEDLTKDIVGLEIKKGKLEETILESLKNSILSVLIEPEDLIGKIKKKISGPFVIIFFGINGSGKTTSIAKLAYKLKEAGISCVLAAGDTFRAASIEQLQKHGSNLGVKVISSSYGADPTAVAFDAKKYAESNGIQAVLIDTAGRMYTKENLIREMEKVIRVIKPDLKIFVGESITGNDATEQAKTFNEAVGIDGIILSKADVDEKAGTVLSVSYVTGKPIYYLGIGQEYEDLKDFSKKDVLKNIGLS